MENVGQSTIEEKKQTEKERLELMEKRVEIQKKCVEIKKEKMSIRKIDREMEDYHLDLISKEVSNKTKQLEYKRMKIEIENLISSRNLEESQVLNEKILAVLLPLIVNVIDDERTVLGSEPFYVPLLTGENKDIALNKLLDLIKRL